MLDLDPVLVDRTWHFADGRTLPLVAGGSDTWAPDISGIGPPAGAADGVDDPGGDWSDLDPTGWGDGGGQEQPPSDPGGQAEQPPSGAQPPDPGTQEPPAPTSFATVEEAVAEIGRLRNENAQRRTQLRDYEQQFGGLVPEDRAVMADFVTHYRNNNDAGMMDWLVRNARVVAERHGTTLEAILGAQPGAAGQPPAAPPAAEPPAQRFDPNDPEQFNKAVDKVVGERFERFTTEQRDAQLRQEATNKILAAFERNQVDVQTPEGQYALFLIKEHKDIDVAFEKLNEYKQRLAEDYVTKKRQQGGQHATTGPAGGSTQSGEGDDVPEAIRAKGPLAVAEHKMNRRIDGLQRPRRAP